MRTVIYITGITGGLAIVLSIIGIFAEFAFNDLLFWGGLILIFAVCIPLLKLERFFQKRHVTSIKRQPQAKESVKNIRQQKTKAKGWDMNSSPFRKRKSGLTWGGGNVKGANASRGNRKSFLR